MRRKFIFLVFIISLFPLFASALGIAGTFGGRVIAFIPCICSANLLVTIGPPKGGQFVYIPGTQGYLNYNFPLIGIWSLGVYSSGGICLQPQPATGCAPGVPFGIPTGIITPILGTSLTP